MYLNACYHTGMSKSKSTPDVYKDNRIVEAAYRLNLDEQRLLLCALTKINSHPEAEPVTYETLFEITADDIASIFPVEKSKAYDLLKGAVATLSKRMVEVDVLRSEAKRVQSQWVHAIEYVPLLGRVNIYFSPFIIPYITQLAREFTRYKLDNVANMTSIYALRLYELLVEAQWKGTGQCEIGLEWLKDRFQIAEEYNEISNLKRRVINPAISQITEHSNLNVTYTQKKEGRNVTAFIFSFSEKTPSKAERPECTSNVKSIPMVQPSELRPQPRTKEQVAKALEALEAAKKAASGVLIANS